MTRLSVIIPSRAERFLRQTVNDVFKKASGEVECIIVFDGEGSAELPSSVLQGNNWKAVYFNEVRGMRTAINAGAHYSTGDFIMKLDGHCLLAEGYDKVLTANCDDDWIVIPRRYSLDAENWTIQHHRPIRDYHYLCYPDPNKTHDGGMHGVEWPERTKERKAPEFAIDDTPCFQGSCYCMSRKHWDKLGGLAEGEIYGKSGWAQEPTELCLKTWLSGGRVVVNKNTFTAHLHKGKKYGRGYDIDDKGVVQGHNWSARHWVNDEEPGMKYKFEWFVSEKFPNMPTWTPDWKEKLIRDGVLNG